MLINVFQRRITRSSNDRRSTRFLGEHCQSDSEVVQRLGHTPLRRAVAEEIHFTGRAQEEHRRRRQPEWTTAYQTGRGEIMIYFIKLNLEKPFSCKWCEGWIGSSRIHYKRQIYD